MDDTNFTVEGREPWLPDLSVSSLKSVVQCLRRRAIVVSLSLFRSWRPWRFLPSLPPHYNDASRGGPRMPAQHDPRVYFAAERTMLAWVRTGLATIGLGFVVARFGLFLRMLRTGDEDAAAHTGSTLIGVGLVLLGAAAMALAARQHAVFCRTLAPGRSTTTWRASLARLVRYDRGGDQRSPRCLSADALPRLTTCTS
jgi:putative membrane protein